MTIRKVLELLQPYAVGARDHEECDVTIDGETEELVIDMGSDIHRHKLPATDDEVVVVPGASQR